MKVDVHEGKLADLVAALRAGEEVVIEEGGEVVARLVAPEGEAPERRPFRFGLLKGQIGEGPDWFEPMDEEELRLWEGDGHPGDPAR